jgi:hypothetical protein
MIFFPALWANLDVDQLGLDDQFAQLSQFVALTTSVTLRNRPFA